MVDYQSLDPNLRATSLAKRDSFLLRIDPAVLQELRQWADDDMRSINAQIEFLLRRALQQTGRLPRGVAATPANGEPAEDEAGPEE